MVGFEIRSNFIINFLEMLFKFYYDVIKYFLWMVFNIYFIGLRLVSVIIFLKDLKMRKSLRIWRMKIYISDCW